LPPTKNVLRGKDKVSLRMKVNRIIQKQWRCHLRMPEEENTIAGKK